MKVAVVGLSAAPGGACEWRNLARIWSCVKVFALHTFPCVRSSRHARTSVAASRRARVKRRRPGGSDPGHRRIIRNEGHERETVHGLDGDDGRSTSRTDAGDDIAIALPGC